MSEPTEAMVDLIEQAMMSGFMQISANKDRIMSAYSGATNQSGGDLLKAALGDYPREFARIRQSLVDAAIEATS